MAQGWGSVFLSPPCVATQQQKASTSEQNISKCYFWKKKKMRLSNLDVKIKKNSNGIKFDNLRIRIVHLDLYLCNSFFFKELKKFSSRDLALQICTLTLMCLSYRSPGVHVSMPGMLCWDGSSGVWYSDFIWLACSSTANGTASGCFQYTDSTLLTKICWLLLKCSNFKALQYSLYKGPGLKEGEERL